MKAKGLCFQWGKDHLRVDFHIPVARHLRILSGLEATIAAGLLVAVLLRRPLMAPAPWLALLGLGGLLLAVVVVRAVQRFTFRERLVLDASHITLLQTTHFSRSVRILDRRHMGPLRHTLAENTGVAAPCRSGDILCEAYGQQIRKAVHAAGNLYFDYKGTRISFGRGVYSWHAEDLALHLQLYCGNSLRFGPEWQPLLETADEQDTDSRAS